MEWSLALVGFLVGWLGHRLVGAVLARPSGVVSEAKTDVEGLRSLVAGLEGRLGAAQSRIEELERELARHEEEDRALVLEALAERGLAGRDARPPAPSAEGQAPQDRGDRSPLEGAPHVVVAPTRDPLDDLPGIDAAARRRLWELGLLTFADVARAEPTTVARAVAGHEDAPDERALDLAATIQAAARGATRRPSARPQ